MQSVALVNGEATARLSVSKCVPRPVPLRPQQMSPIHFLSSAYGGPLFVLNHRGTSDAICWHVMSCHKPCSIETSTPSGQHKGGEVYLVQKSLKLVLYKMQTKYTKKIKDTSYTSSYGFYFSNDMSSGCHNKLQ